ncbi:hypothetical protein CFK62_08275 [Streptococcus agalactiae]|uniref:hypothetical protein n=1 Tax=Streptococcus agalactiae TaxID=1311 RepID=UPI0002E48B9C|nr:hypothetical protein [Streptococcus agalactiae]MCC9994238.1 hypothetical protein [Streptococcus agalactiae]OZV87965.1 hypothetical protein CFK62_08275 [Streptococcus agalactiae]OZV89636.1 hypothetical protein CFK61_08365 [Streptococcus agalactiae]PWS57241.1 hypothetical protein CUZ51_08225 [Streptococcus agalactiae]
MRRFLKNEEKRLKLTCVLSFAVASTLFNLSDLNISYANQNNIQETNLVEKNSEDKFIQELNRYKTEIPNFKGFNVWILGDKGYYKNLINLEEIKNIQSTLKKKEMKNMSLSN